jgi:hypothetical protein
MSDEAWILSINQPVYGSNDKFSNVFAKLGPALVDLERLIKQRY